MLFTIATGLSYNIHVVVIFCTPGRRTKSKQARLYKRDGKLVARNPHPMNTARLASLSDALYPYPTCNLPGVAG